MLDHDDARRAWTLTDPQFLGHIVNHVVLDPRDRRRSSPASAPATSARPCSASTDLGATWRRRRARPRSPSGDRARPRGEARVLAHARPRRRARRLVRRRRRRRACSAPRTAATRGSRSTGWNDHPMWATWARVAGGGHARRLDAALDHRRPARRRAPLPRAVGRRRVREHRRRQRLDAAQRGRAPPTSSPTPTPEFGHDPHCVRLHPRAARPALPAEPLRHLPPRPARRRGGSASATTCRARSATSASRSSCTRATPTRRGCSRWTAPRCGRARAPTAGPRRTSRATPATSWTRLRRRPARARRGSR